MGNTFKKGMLLGGLVGVALTWLNTTKKGKAMRDQIVDHAANIYDDVREKVLNSNTWQTMTETKYYAMVQELVNKYAIDNGLADSVRDFVTRVLNRQWKDVKKEIRRRSTKIASKTV